MKMSEIAANIVMVRLTPSTAAKGAAIASPTVLNSKVPSPSKAEARDSASLGIVS